jgi:hypothetical protein
MNLSLLYSMKRVTNLHKIIEGNTTYPKMHLFESTQHTSRLLSLSTVFIDSPVRTISKKIVVVLRCAGYGSYKLQQ